MRPVSEFREYLREMQAVIAWGMPVWEGERKSGDAAQLTVTEFGVRREAASTQYERYGIQIAVYHPVRDTAADRAHEIYKAFLPLCGTTSGAPGLELDTWRALFLEVEYVGVIDALPTSTGKLYKAVAQVNLLDLRAISI